MLYRLLGKFFFLFYILPSLTRHIKPMALLTAEKVLAKEYQKMSLEQKRQFRKAYPSLFKARSEPKSEPHTFVDFGTTRCFLCDKPKPSLIHNTQE